MKTTSEAYKVPGQQGADAAPSGVRPEIAETPNAAIDSGLPTGDGSPDQAKKVYRQMKFKQYLPWIVVGVLVIVAVVWFKKKA